MWLSNSSIGRKVVMSVTGIALVLFLTFHMAMNLVALFSGEAYNMICEFLGRIGCNSRFGCLVCNSHHLRFLVDYPEPCCTR